MFVLYGCAPLWKCLLNPMFWCHASGSCQTRLNGTFQVPLLANMRSASKECSPNDTMTHERLDHNGHFKIPLGSAAEACNQGFPCNQLPERTIAGICVGPAKNFQEGHEIYDIKTKAIITRSKMTQIPLTPAMIKTVS